MQKKFQLHQVTVKAQSNEALFKLISQAIERKPVQIIVTPRVDRGNYPYYWVGIRFDIHELDFKLLVNNEIINFIHAYLKGDEELPIVTEFNPTEKVENVNEWLQRHEAAHIFSSLSDKEELVMTTDGVSYLTRKFVYKNGKLYYPSIKFDDALNVIFSN